MLKTNTVLVLAPHTDDGEFGCGGTIAKLIKNGSRVICVSFSAAETSVLPEFPRDILRTESRKAAMSLGVKKADCIVLDFEVRTMPENRQLILDKMIKLRKLYEPDSVFLPSTNDTHQDHLVIANEGFRAFKSSNMFAYEVPWNNLNFTTSCFVELDKETLQAKVNSLKMYKSQQHRPYANQKFIESLAMVRGVQINKEYAECFEVIRGIL